MRINRIQVLPIYDSRPEGTLGVSVWDASGREFRASIPAGKSTGKREVKAVPFAKAEKNAKLISEKIANWEFSRLADLDHRLISLDGTKDKSKLGGNLMLGISIAALRGLAHEKKREAWQRLRLEFFPRATEKTPLIFSNLLNGGAHARNGLSIQEYMVVVSNKSVIQGVSLLIEFYKKLGETLAKKGVVPIGDEGGYATIFPNNTAPLEIINKLIAGKFSSFKLALDAAATNFEKGKKYQLDGKLIDGKKLKAFYEGLFRKFPRLLSLEDPFGENDLTAWSDFKAPENRWIVGDDLTTTNPAEIVKHADLISGVIIKPNQIGTVTETCAAISLAHKHNIKVIVSHRSGETADTFIIELAKACGADAVKIGAPTRERIFKFNELIRLYGS